MKFTGRVVGTALGWGPAVTPRDPVAQEGRPAQASSGDTARPGRPVRPPPPQPPPNPPISHKAPGRARRPRACPGGPTARELPGRAPRASLRPGPADLPGAPAQPSRLRPSAARPAAVANPNPAAVAGPGRQVDFQWNPPLAYAAAAGGEGAVRALLAAGADPSGLCPARPADWADGGPAGWSALHAAAAGDRAGVVGLLLAAGADAGRPGPDGRTALDLAESCGAAAAAAAIRARLGLPAPGAAVRVSHVLVKHGEAGGGGGL